MQIMVNKAFLLSCMIILSGSHSYSRANNDGFIAGACAIGAALIGAAGIAAAVDWCWSETDDKLISRIGSEYNYLYSQYAETMNYFGPYAGVGIHPPHRPIHTISESVLYDFATQVWYLNMSQVEYQSRVWSAKHKLQGFEQDLRKRLRSLEGKYTTYEDQKRISSMRDLLRNVQILLADITLFADCLECHKTYLALYDSVGIIRNRYLGCITILESERYTVATEIKHIVSSNDSGQYAFKNFVKNIETEIAVLESHVYSLAYNYEFARKYAHFLISQLNTIKNIIVADPRYQDELYQWEQVRLERQRIEAMEAQARLEKQRLDIIREQNRILEQHNRLEQRRIYGQPVIVGGVPYEQEVSITVNF